MAKLTLDAINSDYASRTKHNTNFDLIEAALENTLSRNGASPNYMQADLDMNSRRIINLPAPINDNEPARWVDVREGVEGIIEVVPSQTGNAPKYLGTNGTSLAWKQKDTFNVIDYGAVGDDTTDDTAKILLARDAIVAAGGGTLYFPGGRTYRVIGVNTTSLFTFTSLNGVTILCGDGATIHDTATYTGTQYCNLFKFVACRNVKVRARVSSQVAITTSTATACGMWVVVEEQGCIGTELDLDVVGCLGGFRPTKASGDPASYRSKNITGVIRASGTYYPYVSQFGSENVDLVIFADTCGRNFYLYGSNQQKITLWSKDQQITNIICAYSGDGCEDVDVWIYDRDSTVGQAAAPRITMAFGDLTPAVLRNIRLRGNLKNPAAAQWGHTITINKYLDGGGTPDTTSRGHLIDGLDVSMTLEGVAGSNHFYPPYGTLTGADIVKNVTFHDMTCTGVSCLIHVPLQVLNGVALFSNVRTEGSITTVNTTSGLCIFDGCTAIEYTSSTGATDTHEYRSSFLISTAPNQNYNTNKSFTGQGLWKGMWKNGLNHVSAGKRLTGDLATAARNIFKVAAIGAGVSGKISYHTVYDRADFTAGTRDEMKGEKSFSAAVNGDGVWVAQFAFADSETERTQGTASVTTFTLVNGTSAGAFIAVQCTAYDIANSVGMFKIELDGDSDVAAVVPA